MTALMDERQTTTPTPTTATASTATASTATAPTPGSASRSVVGVARPLTVEEYRQALHWAWHQVPTDSTTSAMAGPTMGRGPVSDPVSDPASDVASEVMSEGAVSAAGQGPLGTSDGVTAWVPEQVVTVTGLHGGAGASTVALALGEIAAASAGGDVVVIDPAPAAVSGLACAASSELGTRDGWRVGRRGLLELERRDGEVLAPGRSHPGFLLIVDAGIQDLGRWEHEVRAAGHHVVVCSARSAHLLRLDAALAQDPSLVAVITGCPTQRGRSNRPARRWVAHLPSTLRAAVADGRAVCVRDVRGGIDTATCPLPQDVTHAAGRALAEVMARQRPAVPEAC